MFEPVSHNSVYIKTLDIKKGLYNVEAREWDSLMYYDGNSYWVMPDVQYLGFFKRGVRSQ